MCKQDIQIGRKTSVFRRQLALGPAGVSLAFAARPDRIGVNVQALFNTFGGVGDSVYVGVQVNGDVFPLAQIGFGNFNAYLGVEDYGTDVTGDVWVKDNTTGGTIIFVTEYYLVETLESV